MWLGPFWPLARIAGGTDPPRGAVAIVPLEGSHWIQYALTPSVVTAHGDGSPLVMTTIPVPSGCTVRHGAVLVALLLAHLDREEDVAGRGLGDLVAVCAMDLVKGGRRAVPATLVATMAPVVRERAARRVVRPAVGEVDLDASTTSPPPPTSVAVNGASTPVPSAAILEIVPFA